MQNVKPIENNLTAHSAPAASRQKRSRATLWVTVGALVVVIPLVLVSLTIILFQVLELNLPGVVIFDQNVGLKSHEETAAWVDSYWNHARLITLSQPDHPEYAYVASPQDLGYWMDPQATADAAFAIGRDSTPWAEIRAALFGETQIALPVMYFDETTARETLTARAADLAIPPQEAEVAYQDGAWTVVPGAPGQTVDIEATLNVLYANAYTIFLTQSVAIQLEPVAPSVSDLSPILEEIESTVARELQVNAYDPITGETFTWSVPAEIKRAWVNLDSETNAVSLSYDSDQMATLLAGWEAELGNGRTFEADPDLEAVLAGWAAGETQTLIVHHAPTTYQVSAGESLWSISLKLGIPMWYILDANEGLTTSNLETGMALTIPSKNDLLPLPVVPNKRIVIDISDQRMTVYENGQVRNTHIVSTGVADSPTMAGIFQVQTHELNAYASNWDLYMPHFMGIYEAWPGFMNGIHGLPLLSSGVRLWASTLGSPASYGCIILDLDAAEDLYHWAEAGVVVEINP